MKRANRQSVTAGSSTGFTLVELLVVTVIISILAGLTLTVVTVAQSEARIQRTRSTIAKLDAAVAEIYEKYDELNPSVDIDALFQTNLGEARKRTLRKQVQLHFIRETMRMEMPSGSSDVLANNIKRPPIHFLNAFQGQRPNFIAAATTDPRLQAKEPLVYQYYYNSLRNSTDEAEDSAECLFMIIANMNPEALTHFQGKEIGDKDGDGLLEFHDAWGNPISFFRFAPGLQFSEIQPDVVSGAGITGTADWKYGPNDTNQGGYLGANMNAAMDRRSDPFIEAVGLTTGDIRGWYLYPLIVSPGPDGKYGLWIHTTRDPVTPAQTLITSDPFVFPIGMPADPVEDSPTFGRYTLLDSADNISNHQQRF